MSDEMPETVAPVVAPVLRREALLPNERSRGLGTVAIVCTMAGVASGLALATTLMAMQVADSMSSRACPYREAQLALKMQRTARGDDRATCYDDLGVYRILYEVENKAAVELFARQWLGSLLDYDARKGSELVATLSRYLECGGGYDATASVFATGVTTVTTSCT